MFPYSQNPSEILSYSLQIPLCCLRDIQDRVTPSTIQNKDGERMVSTDVCSKLNREGRIANNINYDLRQVEKFQEAKGYLFSPLRRENSFRKVVQYFTYKLVSILIAWPSFNLNGMVFSSTPVACLCASASPSLRNAAALQNPLFEPHF